MAEHSSEDYADGEAPDGAEARVRQLVLQLAQIEAELAELTGGIDAVVDEHSAAPILLSQAQADLAEAQARYDRLVERMAAVVFELAADGTLLFVNRAVTVITGYLPEELKGRRWQPLLFPNELRRELAEHVRRIAVSDATAYEITVATKDGGRAIMQVSTANHYDPLARLEKVVGFAVDISGRKRAEAERAAAEEQVRREAARAEALARMAGRLNAQLDIDAVLSAVCEEAARALDVPAASVALFDEARAAIYHAAGRGLPADYERRVRPRPRELYDEQVGRDGPVLVIPDVQSLPESLDGELYAALNIRTVAGASMYRDGMLIGGLNLFTFHTVRPFTPDELSLLEALANQAASAIANARLFEEVRRSRTELRSLSHHLVELQEEERRNLSRELHDRAGQTMTALKIGLGLLERDGGNPERFRQRLADLKDVADQGAVELHELAVGLRPIILDRYGLLPALEQLVASFRRQGPVEVDLCSSGMDGKRLPGDIETALYRIAQESLTNVARHAAAGHAWIMLDCAGEQIRLTVEDDGRGFDVDEAQRRGRLGLLGMRERAEMLGGKLTLESAPGMGTTLFVQVPASPCVTSS